MSLKPTARRNHHSRPEKHSSQRPLCRKEGKEWVDRVLGLYFGFVGFASVVKAFVLIASGIVGYKKWQALCDHKLTITKRLSDKELEEEKKELEKTKEKNHDGDDDDAPKGRIRSEYIDSYLWNYLHLRSL